MQLSEFAIPFGGLQGLDDKFTTLPQALKKFSYATHMIGITNLNGTVIFKYVKNSSYCLVVRISSICDTELNYSLETAGSREIRSQQ